MEELNSKKVSEFTNLEPNIAAALAYIIPAVTGIVFFLIEKKDNYVRFHAFQSILFGIVLFVAMRITGIFGHWGFAWLLREVISIVAFVFYLALMWKAYQGEKYKLPVLGDIAEKQVG